MAIPQFSGETPYDAIINYESLDIEEEAEFLAFLEEAEIDPATASLETLEQAVTRWHAELHRQEKADGH